MYKNNRLLIRYWRFLLFAMMLVLYGCAAATQTEKAAPKKKAEPVPTPKLLSLTPDDNHSFVKRDVLLTLTFSESMDSGSISVDTENRQCTATIQISTDDFKTCVRMKSIKFEDNNKKITLTPKGTYAAKSKFSIKLSRDIKSKKGGILNQKDHTQTAFETVWSQQLGSVGDDIGYALKISDEGNIYIAGHTSADADGDQTDLVLARFTSAGFQSWIQQSGFQRSVSSAVLSSEKEGKVFLAGISSNEESSGAILTAFDTKGKKVLAEIDPLSGATHGSALAMDQNADIYYAASSRTSIKKMSSKGGVKWGSQLDKGLKLNAISADDSNGLYVTGSMNGTLDGKKSKGGEDVFLLKLYQSGSKRWSKSFGSPLNEAGTALATWSDEFVAVSGYVPQVTSASDAITGKTDVFVSKFDSQGKQIWSTLIKGDATEQSTALLWISEQHLLVAGYTESSLENNTSAGAEDAFVAKLDQDGKVLWITQFGTEKNDRALGIAMSEQQIYVTGFTEGRMDGATLAGGKDIFLVKFDLDGNKL